MSIANNRQIVLDTETTGINIIGAPYEGHCIIEIGAVEVINRRLTGKNFHVYLKPDRLVDPEAFKVHGISDEFLINKPKFSNIVNNFLQYINGAELVIHNATFDIGFINYELSKLNNYIGSKIENLCHIIDSLAIARKIFPGKRNSLDALCRRYEIDNSKRTYHSALLDAKILAEVFLIMTGGQTSIFFSKENNHINKHIIDGSLNNIAQSRGRVFSSSELCVISANDKELIEHENYLDLVQKKNGICLWRKKIS